MPSKVFLPFLAIAMIALIGTAAPGARGQTRGTPTFAKDVAPLLHAHCVTCHRPGEVAPMALRTFDEVRPWARSIKQKVASRAMPPWFADPAHGTFANDARLSQSQIDTIVRWVDAGAPRGNQRDEPKPPVFTEGWQLGEPDYIITLPTVNIPAEGKDYFPTPSLMLDLPEDRWVRALEIRPSNREVTHHSVIFTAGGGGPGGMMGSGGVFNVLGVWAVGTPALVYPEGSGRWLRKGQQLRTNLHYHPNGKPAIDQTRIGIYWGKGELKKEVVAAVAGDLSFEIPPHAKNHEMRAVYVVDQDISVVSYFPHMHLRGKDMTMTATLPNGRKQTLLRVPSYDFNWQLFYYPKDRVVLPRGTRVDIVAHYDNSAENPNNPNPETAVRFGEQSNDEMMFGMFEFVANDGVSPTPITPDSRMEALRSTLPADSSYKVPVTVIGQPMVSILHLPRQGEGAWYIHQGRFQINVTPIRDITWDGNKFKFRMNIRFGARAGFTFDVAGETAADGTIVGNLTVVDAPKHPFINKFSGALKR